MMVSTFELVPNGVDFVVHPLGGGLVDKYFKLYALIPVDANVPICIYANLGNEPGVSPSDAFGDFGTWLAFFYCTQCNPEIGSGYSSNAADISPWVTGGSIIFDPSTWKTYFAGDLHDYKNNWISHVEATQLSSGDGWVITKSVRYPDDEGQIWPSYLAYLEYCIHRTENGGTWSLYYGDKDHPVQAVAADHVWLGVIIKGTSYTMKIYYDSTLCLFGSAATGQCPYLTIYAAIYGKERSP